MNAFKGVLSRSQMKQIKGGSTDVCDIMPGSCACEAYGEGGHEDWDRFEECLDERHGPEQT